MLRRLTGQYTATSETDLLEKTPDDDRAYYLDCLSYMRDSQRMDLNLRLGNFQPQSNPVD